MINQSLKTCYSDFSFGGGDRFKQAGRITSGKGFTFNLDLQASAITTPARMFNAEGCYSAGVDYGRGIATLPASATLVSERSERTTISVRQHATDKGRTPVSPNISLRKTKETKTRTTEKERKNKRNKNKKAYIKDT